MLNNKVKVTMFDTQGMVVSQGTLVKDQTHSIYHSKDIANVQVFNK
jgi:hypothetical protein